MNSISGDQSSKPDNETAPLDLTPLKENPEIQQLLLLALSMTNQQNQQNEQSESSVDNDKRKFDQLNTQSVPSNLGSLSDHSSPGSDTSSDKMLGRPGRKPLTEEEISKSDMDPKSKRKAQNRVAQRAFRERRVNYVKELEDRIKALEENNQEQQQPADKKIVEENRELKKIIQQLQMENAILGGTASSFDVPLSKLTNMTNNGLATTATEGGRPQKLLRSIEDDSTANLFTTANTATHYNDEFSSSPDATISFASHRYSITDNGTSSSASSKSRSLTPPDTVFGGDDDAILFSSATPTDILNSFDTSQLVNPFALDQDLFNTLTITTDTLTTKPTQPVLSLPSSHPKQAAAATATTDLSPQQHISARQLLPPAATTDESSSNDLMESLLVMDDDGTDSSVEVDNTSDKIHQLPSTASLDCSVDASTLTQAWDRLTEHPQFDEFDIDLLCDEMKRKALCSNKTHEDKMKETVDKYYPSGKGSY